MSTSTIDQFRAVASLFSADNAQIHFSTKDVRKLSRNTMLIKLQGVWKKNFPEVGTP
ncbi:MAG: hypothetical protein HRT94_02255 [Alphaproteobacteria bacterium]|nr:hypothetical protein [Alphaproteobacteria bacterium]